MKDWRSSFDERFPRSVKQCFVDYGIDNCIKDELPENCVHESKETCGYYKDYYLMYGTDDIKDFIEALIKETREEEHKKTWDNIKEIYDTTDYKKHIEEAIKETEQRVANDCIKTLNGCMYQDYEDMCNVLKKTYKIGEIK